MSLLIMELFIRLQYAVNATFRAQTAAIVPSGLSQSHGNCHKSNFVITVSYLFNLYFI